MPGSAGACSRSARSGHLSPRDQSTHAEPYVISMRIFPISPWITARGRLLSVRLSFQGTVRLGLDHHHTLAEVRSEYASVRGTPPYFKTPALDCHGYTPCGGNPVRGRAPGLAVPFSAVLKIHLHSSGTAEIGLLCYLCTPVRVNGVRHRGRQYNQICGKLPACHM